MPELSPSSPVARRPLVLGLAFGGWTVYVWATRIRNALGDDDQSTGERLVTLAMSSAFVAGGLAVAAGKEQNTGVKKG